MLELILWRAFGVQFHCNNIPVFQASLQLHERLQYGLKHLSLGVQHNLSLTAQKQAVWRILESDGPLGG